MQLAREALFLRIEESFSNIEPGFWITLLAIFILLLISECARH